MYGFEIFGCPVGREVSSIKYPACPKKSGSCDFGSLERVTSRLPFVATLFGKSIS